MLRSGLVLFLYVASHAAGMVGVSGLSADEPVAPLQTAACCCGPEAEAFSCGCCPVPAPAPVIPGPSVRVCSCATPVTPPARTPSQVRVQREPLVAGADKAVSVSMARRPTVQPAIEVRSSEANHLKTVLLLI